MDISIVIPLYNKKDTVARALQSVMMQTYSPREIIVVNDGSSDGSEDVVRKMDIACLRLVEQENAGVSAARNRGIKEANGEWVAFLDGDDEWLPDFLATISRLHEIYPEHDVYATAYYAGDYQMGKKKIILKGLPFSGIHGILTNYFDVASLSAPPLWSSAICIRRQILFDIGGFPLNVKSGEDLLTWARLAARNAPVYCTLPLAVFWQDKAHTYDDRPNRMPEIDDPVGKALVKLNTEYHPIPQGLNAYISHWHKMRASIYLRLNMRYYALKECIKGIVYQPGNFRLYIYMALSFMPDRFVMFLFKKLGK